MAPRRLLGYGLRIVATLLMLKGALHALAVAMGLLPSRGGGQLMLALAQIAIAALIYMFGVWLVRKPPMVPLGARAQAARGRWWRLDFGARLSLLAAVAWVVGTFLFQDKWEREIRTTWGPAIAIICLYVGYRYLVVGQDRGGPMILSTPHEPQPPSVQATAARSERDSRMPIAPTAVHEAVPRTVDFDIGAVRPGRD